MFEGILKIWEQINKLNNQDFVVIKHILHSVSFAKIQLPDWRLCVDGIIKIFLSATPYYADDARRKELREQVTSLKSWRASSVSRDSWHHRQRTVYRQVFFHAEYTPLVQFVLSLNLSLWVLYLFSGYIFGAETMEIFNVIVSVVFYFWKINIWFQN